MNTSLENELLGQLILSPGLLESCDEVDAAIFSQGDAQAAFAGIAAQWEELRPNTIDVSLLARKTGLAESWLLGLTDGNFRPDPATFSFRVVQLRRQRTGAKITRLAAVEGQHLVKTGELDEDRLAELEGLLASLRGNGKRGGRFISTIAGQVQTRRVRYLWRDVVAFGMPTAFVGDPGEGKTFACADATARITRGLGFPTYASTHTEPATCGKVVYITSEGVPDRILVPRLIAAGADLDKVEIITGVYGEKGKFKLLDVSAHLPDLAAQLKNDQDVRLVVIDPIASHLSPKLNTNSTLEMRQAMDEVARFAEELDCAVIVVMHLNKDERKTAINRVSGSVQFLAAVKSAWAVLHKPDDDNPNRRYFSPVKNNLAPFHKSMSFEIRGAAVTFSDGSTDEIGRIVWSAEPEDFDVQAAISPGAVELKSKAGAAIAFLRDRLAAGPRKARELYDEAEALGISKDTLWRAKRKEGVVDGREGFGPGFPSMWYYGGNGGQE